MTGIWTNSGEGWVWGKPRAFENEATLQELIRKNPQFLPLSGSPRLVVLGSEIQLGNGYADILAVESSGRPAIIEVKLHQNPEARRAVVSQVIAYAAFLQGFNAEELERGPLHRFLAEAEYRSIFDAVEAQDQEGAVDADSFAVSLQEHLREGSFRLVLVLDDIPFELERVIAYLDAITVQVLTIDLITIKVYEVNGAQIILPQRVSPELGASTPSGGSTSVASRGSRPVVPRAKRTDGSDVFRTSIEDTTGEAREMFYTLIAWAEELASLPNIRLFSSSGPMHYTLLPYIMPDKVGLVTIWNSDQKPYATVWRTVVERLAPNAIASVERSIQPDAIRQSYQLNLESITPEILETLSRAYQEASGG